MGLLVPPAAGWIAGLLAGFALPAGPWQAPLALIGLVVGMALAVWGLPATRLDGAGDAGPAPRWVGPALALPALLAGAAAGPGPPRALQQLAPAGMARVDGVVEASRRMASERARAVVRVLRGKRLVDGTPVAGGTLLSVGPYPLPDGAHVRLVGKLRARVPFRNPSPHPPVPPRHAIRGRLWLPDRGAIEVVGQGVVARLLTSARGRVRDGLTATLGEPSLGIARAVVLGEGGAVDEAVSERVREAGLAHVLAVSGLHVALLAGVAVALVRLALLWTPLARRLDVGRVACAVGVPLAHAHAAFAGGGPSAVRAATTASLAWGMVAAGRRPRAGAVVAMAVLVLGALDPAEAARPGFLLSILATAAIVAAPPRPRGSLAQWLRAGLSISVRTTLATAPLVLWCFGAVPLVGVLANVVVVPMASVLLVPAAALHAALASVSPELATPTAAVVEPAARAFVATCEAFAALAPAWRWPVPDVWQGAVLVCLAAGWLVARRARTLALIGAVAALALGGLELRLREAERPTGELRVTFLDVGQGDAALVDLPDGRCMLIDAGGNPSGGLDPGRAVVAPLLAARRRARLDFVVLSHPHPDHYGGLAAVLEQVPVAELWDSGQAVDEADMSPTAAAAATLLQHARAAGTRVRGPASLCGRALTAGSATVRLLAPCPGYDSAHGANDNSLVLRIDHGDVSVLFTGDAEAHAEARLVASGAPLRADVLKVGHHGSRTSTSEAFLRAVSPRLAVISAGAVNPFGHPHAEVRARLEAMVPRVVELATTGGAVLRSDGQRWRLSTWSGLEATSGSEGEAYAQPQAMAHGLGGDLDGLRDEKVGADPEGRGADAQ